MTQYVKEKIEHVERPLTSWIILGVIVCLMFSYAYFVNGAISNIVAAKDMESETSALTSSLGSMESTYLADESTVNYDYAVSLGFKEAESDTVYITKKSLDTLSFNR